MWLDIFIALPILWGLIQGLIKGLISEAMAILAVVLGVLGARHWGPSWALWFMGKYHWHSTICNILAYAILFIAIAVVLTLLAHLLSRLFKAIHLGVANRIFGGIFGMLKWGLLVLVLIFFVGQLDIRFRLLPADVKASSHLYAMFLDWSSHLWHAISAHTAHPC